MSVITPPAALPFLAAPKPMRNMHSWMQHHSFLLVDLAEEEEQQQLGTVLYLRPRPNKHMLADPFISSNLDLCQ